ncbi:MAG: hypothetical protein ACK56I_31665, partial [bacterium]
HEAPPRQPWRGSLGDAKFRRIDEVVSGIHPHHPRADVLEFRRGIVVARRGHLVEKIVRVQQRQPLGHGLARIGIGDIAGRQLRLHRQRRAASDQQQTLGGAQTGERLLRVVATGPR